MTIYALSTGPGISGVAIVRVSGIETTQVIKLLTNKPVPKPRLATLRKINKINTSELIDEGIILWFPGPESYTGEDMVEFHVHGSKAVIEALHTSIEGIKNCALQTLAMAGVSSANIDTVIFVGGSSLMSIVENAMIDIFPTAKQYHSEAFTAIVDGLSIAASRPDR